MINIIFSYQEKDPEYFQLLLTIMDNLAMDEKKDFEILLLKSELEKRKITINYLDKNITQDFITMNNLKLKYA